MDKRAHYDYAGYPSENQGQSQGYSSQDFSQGFGGGGGFDIFEQIFKSQGGRNPFGGQQVQKGADIQTAIGITFMEAVKGVKKDISLMVEQECKPCDGSGLKPGKSASTCTVCRGSGQVQFGMNNH